ncbi:MAG: CPBP family intramembrane metalloprotease [Fibrobacteria bacterium]|nr:CPBP family intramembrane metalloprotease [Fibrobacteria bacterium]
MKRADLILLGVALLGGTLFLGSRHRLWPETGLELVRSASEVQTQAMVHRDAVGLDGDGWVAATHLDLDLPALTWLESTRDRDVVRRLLRSGTPLYTHSVQFKKPGHAGSVTVRLHPDLSLAGWTRTVEDDEKGASLDSSRAWEKARSWILLQCSEDLLDWSLRRYGRRAFDDRVDHDFLLERARPDASDVRERLSVRLAGAEVVEVRREVVVPPAFLRDLRTRSAPETFLRTLALTIFASLGCAAFLLKLQGLRKGLVGLRVPTIGAALVLVCLGLARVLRPARLVELWDPMGDRWMAVLRLLMGGLINDLLPAVLVFAFLAAADALDRQAPRHRGIALRNFLRLRWDRVDVGHASLRGFLLGLVAGGVLAGATWLLSWLPGARVALQPRGFFFYGINSALPAVVLGVYFLQIAMVEELGWRHFAGNLFLRLRLGPILAVAIPAVVYGASHAGLDFLPPAEPWWARVIPIALVGGLWGWAFLRWDALTVFLSHWACDLFLFNQPRLASASTGVWLSALACIALPLLPAAVNLGIRLTRKARRIPNEDWNDESDFDGTDPVFDPESAFDPVDEAEPSTPEEPEDEPPSGPRN